MGFVSWIRIFEGGKFIISIHLGGPQHSIEHIAPILQHLFPAFQKLPLPHRTRRFRRKTQDFVIRPSGHSKGEKVSSRLLMRWCSIICMGTLSVNVSRATCEWSQ